MTKVKNMAYWKAKNNPSPLLHTEDPHTPHRKNTSFKGSVMTNTETGETYDLKTGKTTKPNKPTTIGKGKL